MQAGDFSQWRTSAVKQLFSDDPHQYWLCQLAGKIGGSGLEPLTGIRAARLWRQLGGHRWQLVFSRRKLLNELRPLLRS